MEEEISLISMSAKQTVRFTDIFSSELLARAACLPAWPVIRSNPSPRRIRSYSRITNVYRTERVITATRADE